MTRLPPTRLTRMSTPWVVLLLSTTSASSDPSSSECMCGNGWAKCLYPGGESFREGDGGAGAGCGRTGKSCADVCPDSDYRQDQQQSVAAWKTVYREALERGATLEQRCESADTTADWGESQILRDLLQRRQRRSPQEQPQEGRRPQVEQPMRFAIAFAGGMRNFAAVWPSWEANVVEASGGAAAVDLYFHVWRDEHASRSSAVATTGVRPALLDSLFPYGACAILVRLPAMYSI